MTRVPIGIWNPETVGYFLLVEHRLIILFCNYWATSLMWLFFTRVIITIVYLVSPDFEFCFFKSQDTANCSCFWFSLPSSTRTCCESVRLPSSVVPERKQSRYLLMIQIMIQISNNLEADYVSLLFPLYSCMMQRLHATNSSKHIYTILIQ